MTTNNPMHMRAAVWDATNELCGILINDYFKGTDRKEYNQDYTFQVEEGKKYLKLISVFGQRSVHAFVDKNTGDLYKAASWNAPAKGVRFNLLRDMEMLRKIATWHTGYLYK